MEASDKKRIIKPAPRLWQYRPTKRHYVIAGIVVAMIILITAGYFLLTPSGTKTARSYQLSSKITDLEKNDECSDGLKQVSSKASSVQNGNTYDITSREKTLDYLMGCNSIDGNYKQALVYAQQLNALFVQQGNTQKQQVMANVIARLQRAIAANPKQ